MNNSLEMSMNSSMESEETGGGDGESSEKGSTENAKSVTEETCIVSAETMEGKGSETKTGEGGWKERGALCTDRQKEISGGMVEDKEGDTRYTSTTKYYLYRDIRVVFPHRKPDKEVEQKVVYSMPDTYQPV